MTASILGVALFLAASSLHPLITPPPAPQTIQTYVPVTAFYFYGDGCSHCEKVKPLITNLQSKYPELNLTQLEIYNNADNRLQTPRNEPQVWYCKSRSPDYFHR